MLSGWCRQVDGGVRAAPAPAVMYIVPAPAVASTPLLMYIVLSPAVFASHVPLTCSCSGRYMSASGGVHRNSSCRVARTPVVEYICQPRSGISCASGSVHGARVRNSVRVMLGLACSKQRMSRRLFIGHAGSSVLRLRLTDLRKSFRQIQKLEKQRKGSSRNRHPGARRGGAQGVGNRKLAGCTRRGSPGNV